MAKKAVLIGINYTNTDLELKGCITDVIKMEEFLTKKGYRCIKLIDTPENVDTDKYPLKRHIIKWLNWLVKNTKKNNKLFLHFSGHGSFTNDVNNDERDHKDETIVPLDCKSAGIIKDDFIVKILSSTPADVFTIFDCCHSGTILDLIYRYEPFRDIPFTDKKYSETDNNIISISGCRDNQTSAEVWFKRVKQNRGALTYFIITELNKDNNTYKIMLKNIRKYLNKCKLKQIPQLHTSKKIDFNSNIDF